MLIEQVKRVYNANKDVPNTPPSKEQDCSDILDISIFFDGTGNNKDADEDKKKWSNAARLWRNAVRSKVQTSAIKTHWI